LAAAAATSIAITTVLVIGIDSSLLVRRFRCSADFPQKMALKLLEPPAMVPRNNEAASRFNARSLA